MDKYTRAREDQADTLADEILDIADEKIDDFIIDEEGNKRPNPDTVQRSKLRVEARKWIAAKLKPKKYGEKIDHNIGGQANNPLVVSGMAALQAMICEIGEAAETDKPEGA